MIDHAFFNICLFDRCVSGFIFFMHTVPLYIGLYILMALTCIS